MASNEYNDMTELIKDYNDVPVGNYLNQSIKINNVTLTCDIYRVEAETVLTPSVFTGCTAVDANTQIVIGRNMSVASGTTLTPPYRCKGIIIGDVGTFTNEGTISMTARGASGEGKNIQLTEDYMISAVGGAGGASATRSGSYGSTSGNSGSSPSSGILSCGGGGSGSVYSSLNASTVTSGAGASGTSFSGGAGGGGVVSQPTLTGYSATTNGGAGGNARVHNGSQEGVNSTLQATGGAGNPNGSNIYNSTYYHLNTRGTGAGGLIIVLASKIVSSGVFQSQGSQADYLTYTPPSGQTISGYQFAIGGSSGGGCIVLLSKERNITGTHSVTSSASTGGTNNTSGGAGGDGVYASYIVDDLILANLPVEIAISDTNHLDNIEPSEGVRLLGMMDDDELYYEIMGTRHRAMNTEGALDLSKIIPPGQRTPDQFEVAITNPQEGQVMKYNATTEQWENGDAASGLHEYSTEEKVIGTWIDSKPIYERTIVTTMPTITTDTSISEKLVNITDANIEKYIFGFGRINNQMNLERTWTSGNTVYFSLFSYLNNDNFVIQCNRISLSELPVNMTIQYTKATDTV